VLNPGLLFLLLAALLGGCVSDLEVPEGQRVFREIPDFAQNNTAYSEQYNPMTLCAPVAVANSLTWLGVSLGEGSEVEMVRALASREFMRTHHGLGTSPEKLMKGLTDYLSEAGVAIDRLRYRGWREVSEQYRDTEALNLQWLLQGIGPGQAVWLNLGWHDRKLPGYYYRKGGHWVTLVGYSDGGLLVHDPGPWQASPSPLKVRQHHVLLMRTRFGASAFNQVFLELVDSPAAQEGITLIEGAVRLDLSDPRPFP